jgi:hypothetical protein
LVDCKPLNALIYITLISKIHKKVPTFSLNAGTFGEVAPLMLAMTLDKLGS